jgi:magnesium transporter
MVKVPLYNLDLMKKINKKYNVRSNFSEKISSSLALIQDHKFYSITEEHLHGSDLNDYVDYKLRQTLASFIGSEAATLLEMLPQNQRNLVWLNLEDKVASDALVEVVDDVASQLIEHTNSARLDIILSLMAPNQLIDIIDILPAECVEKAKHSLSTIEQEWFDTTIEYSEEYIGNLMSAEYLTFNANQTVVDVSTIIRELPDLPHQSDKVFVVNNQMQLEGVVTLIQLLRHSESEILGNIMDIAPICFQPTDKAEEAGLSFERNDLISAPVINENNVVVGRLTVESVMDYIREKTEQVALAKEGLDVDSDLFGPILLSARKRWLWLSINLITAFFASRFIGLFEDSITQLVALATLMPIVASVGGNTGNQTIALLIRGISLGQVRKENFKFLFIKELSISLINGLLWGSVLGGVAYAIYGNLILSLVLTAATMLNLIVAALVGMVVPIALDKLGKDPVMGSSVILTFITDSMGFFIFLSLATVFLI